MLIRSVSNIRSEQGGILVVAGLLLLIVLGVLLGVYALSPAVRDGIKWRTRLITLKSEGNLPELSWKQLVQVISSSNRTARDSRIIEAALKMALQGNPYREITNPHTSATDITAGQQTFRSHCAGCHGVDGKGAVAPDLTRGFRHGTTDWALFRNTRNGIAGTKMEGFDLPEKSIWQLVAFLRILSRGQTEDSPPVAQAPFPNRVTYERILRADREPENWLTYSGGYNSQRYSQLNQISRDNISKLKVKWSFQLPTVERVVEASPIVVGDVMFITEPPNNVIALDTATGTQLWKYEKKLAEGRLPLCCGRVNRGLAVLGDRLYMGTLDARLIALDAKTGKEVWNVEVADHRTGYSITGAPLAVKDKIITGIAGGEFGIRGFLDAYDANTGKRLWRFYTVPGSGDPGRETWSGESWKTGGAPTWLTGSFDPELNLLYWAVGNPGPVFQGSDRQGDNLYSNSVIALDIDTGKLKWYFQFTPHDEYDWDSVQIPVLADLAFNGKPRKLMLWANRNGFFYLLDRETGQFLSAREYTHQNWAERIDEKGRPIRKPGSSPSPKGTFVRPGGGGATNWWSPSHSPLTGLFYVPVNESSSIFFQGSAIYNPGHTFMGSAEQEVPEGPAWKGVRAIDPTTGKIRWQAHAPSPPDIGQQGGILSTAGNVVFGGSHEQFYALDAETGKDLWKFKGKVIAAPVTYLSKGRQQVTVAIGRSIFTFGLDE